MFNMANVTCLYVSQKYGEFWNAGYLPTADEHHRGPLDSIERALEKIVEMRRAGAKQPITIKLVDEVYQVKQSIVIDQTVSSVTIEAYNKTLVSGGLEVRNFKEDSFNGVACFSADLSEYGDLEFSDFYVNGKRADFTRYPQKGLMYSETVETNNNELYGSSKWLTVSEADFAKLKSFKNAESCFISYNHYWIDEHTPIESLEENTRRVVFQYPSRFNISGGKWPAPLGFIVENVAEEFKNPNEWYYDVAARILYYIPENGQAKTEELVGYVPLTAKLFEVKGTPEDKVRNIRFQNLEFAYTKGDYHTADGFAADPQAVCGAHGSIEFTNTYSCAVENCRLHCFGVHGIVMYSGCVANRVCHNEISWGGASALVIGGGRCGDAENTFSHGHVISHNVIFDCGKRHFAACGLLIKDTYESVISYNDISNVIYTGISVGWVWGYFDSMTHHNIVECNHIHDIGGGPVGDMGAIYLLGRQEGTIVRNNMIHDVGGHYAAHGIYTDEGSSYITVENNIVYKIKSLAYHQHYGCMNTIRNNVFAYSGEELIVSTRDEMHPGIIFDRNILVTAGKTLMKCGKGHGVQTVPSCRNIIYDVEREEPIVMAVADKKYNLKESQEILGQQMGSVVADPGFVDVVNCDFRLKDDSIAYEFGFIPIDTTYMEVIAATKRRWAGK